MTQIQAIQKLQQATNPETPIPYREFIRLARDILNCSFVGEFTKDKKFTYRGVDPHHKGLIAHVGKYKKIQATYDVVYIEK